MVSSTFRNNNIRWQVVSEVSIRNFRVMVDKVIAGRLFVNGKFLNVEEKLNLEITCAQKYCEDPFKLL